MSIIICRGKRKSGRVNNFLSLEKYIRFCKRLCLPVPRYYVFYNGLTERPDEEIWYLTDSVEGEAASEKSCVQFRAHMVNINMERN